MSLKMDINGVMVDVVLREVHMDRLNTKIAENAKLTEELRTYTADGVDWKAKAETSATELATMTTKYDAKVVEYDGHVAQVATNKVLSDAGVTDSYHQKQVLSRYNEAADGADLPAWLKDSAKADAYISHVFGAVQDNTANKGPGSQVNRDKASPENTGNGAGGITPEQYVAMSAEEQSKNYDKYLADQGYAMPDKPV